MSEAREYLIEAEAADFLRLAPRTLANKRVTGNGPAFIKAGGRVLYARADLRAFLEGNRRRSTSEHPEAA